MRKLAFLMIAFLAIFFTNCSKSDSTVSPEMTVTSTLSGANEVPAVTSTATGTVTGKYNKDSKILTITVTYTDLTPTAGHIHKGASTATGGVIFGFTNINSPFTYTSPALTSEQETDLLAGNYYVNLHTVKNPGGEIRGQLAVK